MRKTETNGLLIINDTFNPEFAGFICFLPKVKDRRLKMYISESPACIYSKSMENRLYPILFK